MTFDSDADELYHWGSPIAGLAEDVDAPQKKPDEPTGLRSTTSDFEDAGLDSLQDIDLTGQTDEISKLIVYVQGVTYANYQRQEFDDRLDTAKFSLQSLNYYKDLGIGYLKDEADRLAIHYDRIPFWFSCLAYSLTFVLTLASLFYYVAENVYPIEAMLGVAGNGQALKAYATAINFLLVLGLALGVTLLCYGLGRAASAWKWWADFEYRNSGNYRAKNIRLRNHDVLVNKIKNLQQVAGERARNKDPDRGASGLLRVYLLFICGYVLHKTLNRCHTRFRQDFEQIWVPAVKARIGQLGWMTFVAGIGLSLVIIYKFADFERNDISLLSSLCSVLFLPLLMAWAVQHGLVRRALRQKGDVIRKMNFLNSLYHTHLPSTMLAAFNESETERTRFDFPDIYQYNDIEEYATWHHNTLNALKRHEDETRK